MSEFIRSGATITEVESGKATIYFKPGTEKSAKPVPSINAAKRESRKIQGGNLGGPKCAISLG